MLKDRLYQASLSLAAFVALGATSAVVAQSDAASTGTRPLAAKSIRPMQREEIPANKAPNLYDETSNEFDYFREELGRSETSTATKKRLAQIAARKVYDDPNDKPAADGSPFVDIYADIVSDGKPFEDPNDPDVIYYADEHNILAKAATFCKQATTLLKFVSGGLGTDSRDGSMGTRTEMEVMPSYDLTSTGSMSGMEGPGGTKAQADKPAPESKVDDTKIIFPDPVDNPYKSELGSAVDPFDLFKADRDFKPAPAQKGGPGSMGSGYPMEEP
ncbi:MAG: hypothetical protein ACI4NP_00235 [Thermoguttaceae bacterium]